MTPISVHREKKGERVIRRGEEEQTRGKVPLTVGGRKRRKEASQKCNRTRSEPSDSSF